MAESKFSLRKKRELFLSEEDALEQLMLFLEFYEIDLVTAAENMTEKSDDGSTVTADEIGDTMVKLVREKRISFEESDKEGVLVTQYLSNPIGDINLLKFGKLKAKHRKIMGRAEKQGKEAMIQALVGAVCSSTQDMIEKLTGSDVAVMSQLGAFYFLV
jgi:hypothetical protein